MAWPSPLDNRNNSPTGFWPHPDEEDFYRKQTPWKVPKKRKSKGKKQLYYDHITEDVQFTVGEEITTYNRFQLLSDDEHVDNQIVPTDKIDNSAEMQIQQAVFSEERSFSNFMNNNNKISNNNYYFCMKEIKTFVQVTSQTLLPLIMNFTIICQTIVTTIIIT